MNDDPLLRAIADGDASCPDGRSLIKLGRLAREALSPPGPVDLVPRVLSAIATRPSSLTAASMTLAGPDPQADGEVSDPVLDRLGDLIRQACTVRDPVDLSASVRRRLAAGSRRERSQTSGFRLDAASRWRIWTSVIAAHAAALIAFGIYHFSATPSPDEYPTLGGGISITMVSTADLSPRTLKPVRESHGGSDAPPSRSVLAPATATIPAPPPHDWLVLPDDGQDLFGLRRSSRSRRMACNRFAMAEGHGKVPGALNWLMDQERADGAFAHDSGDTKVDLAVDSVATLALLGEGPPSDARTANAIRHALVHLISIDPPDIATDPLRAVAGLRALALTEGAGFLRDAYLIDRSEDALADLAGALPTQPGSDGLAGFALLALETGRIEGLQVDLRALARLRLALAQAAPASDDADVGRLGLEAFARFIYGHGDGFLTASILHRLDRQLPQTDAAHRVDPLRWFFPTLAMREAGGHLWSDWASHLQASLLSVTVGGCVCHVPADRVSFAGSLSANGDLFATALVVLDLQAPYRYLPLSDASP